MISNKSKCASLLVYSELIKQKCMMQLYPKESFDIQMQPKKETIQFLIHFSKSLTIVKTKSKNFIELNLN